MPIGVVPWTLRHQVFTVEQVKNTYEKLHALGFDGIESGLGTGIGLSAAEDLALLKEYSLTPCSVYTDIKDPEKAVETAKQYGVTVLGAPSIPGIMMRRADGFYAYAEELNRLAEPFRGTGIRLQYHNHSQEFRNFPELNGKSGLQILIENTDPELMAFELDVFWASAAGCDPVEWIEKLKGRIPIIHYKDYAVDCASEIVGLGDVPRMFAEVGQGNLNWKAITAAARDAGVEWYNIEQDQTKRPVFESLQISIDYMRDVLHIQ